MLYKPNFCCNCGEKIERVEWNLLTSRRFCPACSIEHRRYDNIPRAIVAAGGLAVAFGLGSIWAVPASVNSVTPAPAVSVKSSLAAPAARGTEPPALDSNAATGETRASVVAVKNSAAKQPPPPAQTFFCGALTKKGTPCSRKVKAKGTRCFQHEGRPEAPSSE